MKKLILFISVLFVSIISYSQSPNIIGAWLYRDSKTSFSLIIKEDGTIQSFSRPINDATPPQNIKRGTYVLKANKKLIIIWSDKSSETDKIKVLDRGTLQIELKDSATKSIKTYIFQKVFDEEVELPKN